MEYVWLFWILVRPGESYFSCMIAHQKWKISLIQWLWWWDRLANGRARAASAALFCSPQPSIILDGPALTSALYHPVDKPLDITPASARNEADQSGVPYRPARQSP